MKRSVHLLTLFFLVTLLVSLYLFFSFDQYTTRDAFDYAHLAERIANGSGFTSRVITPLYWSVVPDLPHPDFSRAPLYPLLVASGFQLVGPVHVMPVLVSALTFLFTVFLVYWIGDRFRGRNVAFYAGLLAVTFAPLFEFGVAVMTESTFTMIFMAAVLVVLWDEEHPYLVGILTAFAYLARFNAWFFLLGVLLVGYRNARSGGGSYLLKVLGTTAVVLSPWMIRNVQILGRPLYHHQIYELVSFNSLNPGYTVYFLFDPPNPLSFALRHFNVVFEAWIVGIMETYIRLIPELVHGIWLPVVLAAVAGWNLVESRFKKEVDTCGAKILSILLIGGGIQWFVMGLAHLDSRYFIPLLPLVAVLAGATIDRVIKKRRWVGYSVLLATILFNVYFLLSIDFNRVELNGEDYRTIQRYVPEEELVVTNRWLFLPWFSDRTSLAAPATYPEAVQNYPRFNYVYLEDFRRSLLMPNPGRVAKNYRDNSQFLSDFRVLKQFSPGSVLFVRRGYMPGG